MGGRASILLACSAAILGLLPASAPAQTWSIQYVDVGQARAGTTSLGLDRTGGQVFPVISYFGAPRVLKFAGLDRTSKIWGLTRVDASAEFNSLDVDVAGIVHVAYLDDAGHLNYWRKNQGQGSIQLIDTDVGSVNSIRVVQNTGTPHVSYWRSNSSGVSTPDRLKVADYSGTSWVPSFADPAPLRGRYNSLVLDGSGNPGVAYYDGGAQRLRIGVRVSGNWSYDLVDSIGNPGRFNSVQINASALARISYIASTPQTLRYAASSGTAWLVQDVTSVGPVGGSSATSLAIDTNGTAHIAYYNADSGAVFYVSRSGATWGTPVRVDDVGTGGGYCSLQLDTSFSPNRPIVSYYDAASQSVRIAYGDYPDIDGDGIPDTYDAFPSDPDHNSNGILDGKEGGVAVGASGVARLKDEPIFGCGSLAAVYAMRRGGGPPSAGGPPPADLLVLLAPAAYLLLRKRALSRPS